MKRLPGATLVFLAQSGTASPKAAWALASRCTPSSTAVRAGLLSATTADGMLPERIAPTRRFTGRGEDKDEVTS